MIRNVLVGIDGSEPSLAAADGAIWIAGRFSATLTGLHVVDIVSIEGSFLHDISGSLGFEPYLDFSSRMREALTERGKALLDDFAGRASEAGLTAQTDLATGVIANELCERARRSDLLVIGHRGVNERFSTGLLGGTAEGVARKCSTPVLVCPTEWREITNPLLAYDGSDRSSAAMHLAAEFCTATKLPLTVVHVARDEESGRPVLVEAESYLESYDIEISSKLLTGYAAEGIEETLKTDGHDLLFIGAYGHSRILELVLGSTTEYLLRTAGCPVILNR